SMRFAVVTGMIGAVLVAMIGIAWWSFMLVLIAVFGFMACLQQRRMLLEAGPYGFDDVDYGESLYDAPRQRRTSLRAKKRIQRQAMRRHAEQHKIDRILAKVSAKGMQSLTWWEKRTLRKGSERMR